MHSISRMFETVGVMVIVVGFAVALVAGALRLRSGDFAGAYRALRYTFGRTILLGLEILVAADLIQTISVEATLSNLAILAALVAIRTFLSWSLEVEIEGMWPWQRARSLATSTAPVIRK